MTARGPTDRRPRGGGRSETNESSSRRTGIGRLLPRIALAIAVLLTAVTAGIIGVAAPVAAASDADEGLQIEVQAIDEDYVVVDVRFPDETYADDVEFPDETYLGQADQFVVHEEEDAVSLPEDTEGLANPIDGERIDERTYRLYFRTEDLDLSGIEEDEGVTLGLGTFSERTVPGDQWDTSDLVATG